MFRLTAGGRLRSTGRGARWPAGTSARAALSRAHGIVGPGLWVEARGNRRRDRPGCGLAGAILPPMTPTIREMTIEDYPRVHVLWKASEGIGLSEADERPAIESYLRRNPGMSFVAAEHAGEAEEIVAAVLCGHDGRRGFIHHLAVRSDRRRLGLGRLLAQRCIDALQGAGIGKCHLFVFRRNRAAIEFWAETGWAERGDLVIMSRSVPPPD